MRLLFIAAACWLAAALGLGGGWRLALVLGLGASALGLLSLALRRASASIALIAVGLCLLATAMRLHERQTGPLHDAGVQRSVATIDAVVTTDPHVVTGRVIGQARSSDLVFVAVSVRRLQVAGQAYAVRADVEVRAADTGWSTLLPSERIHVSGRLAPPRPGEVVAADLTARGAPVRLAGPTSIQRAAQRLRTGLRASASGLAIGPRGLLPGLVDGDTSGLDAQVQDDFRATSLTHLVAVSGSNVSITLACLLGLATLLGLNPRARAVLAVLGLIAFVLVARPSPSVLRAAAMGAVTLLALLTGRPRRVLPALGTAVIVLIAHDPDLARSVGFALSTFATAGIVLLGPWLEERLPQRWPAWLRQALAIPMAAQLACAPVIGAVFGMVGLSAVPANLLAAPAVAPATISGIVAAVAALLWMPCARLAAELGGYACGWLVLVAHRFARLPSSSIALPIGVPGAAIALLITIATVFALLHRSVRRATLAALLGCILASAALVPIVEEQWPPVGWAFAACDVGQGDALVVRGGAAGDVLIDTGPDPAKLHTCLGELGVHRLQRVILTHLHADHVEGLSAVLGHVAVAELEVGPLQEPPEEWARVQRWASTAGVPIVAAQVGERARAGDAEWEVLGPRAVFHGTDSDPNNASLVLALRTHGVSILLTGDAEDIAQSSLLARTGDGMVQADVLKVPHHGSAKQDPSFLDRIHARITVTSVGLGNPYGHPSPITLTRLARDGAEVLRTDLDGSVAIAKVGERVVAFPSKRRRGTPGAPPGLPVLSPTLAALAADKRFWCT